MLRTRLGRNVKRFRRERKISGQKCWLESPAAGCFGEEAGKKRRERRIWCTVLSKDEVAYGRVLWRAFHRYPPLISPNHRAASSAKLYISRVTPRFVKSHHHLPPTLLLIFARVPPSLLFPASTSPSRPPFHFANSLSNGGQRFSLLGHWGARGGEVCGSSSLDYYYYYYY